jgi:hypothetical protein
MCNDEHPADTMLPPACETRDNSSSHAGQNRDPPHQQQLTSATIAGALGGGIWNSKGYANAHAARHPYPVLRAPPRPPITTQLSCVSVHAQQKCSLRLQPSYPSHNILCTNQCHSDQPERASVALPCTCSDGEHGATVRPTEFYHSLRRRCLI